MIFFIGLQASQKSCRHYRVTLCYLRMYDTQAGAQPATPSQRPSAARLHVRHPRVSRSVFYKTPVACQARLGKMAPKKGGCAPHAASENVLGGYVCKMITHPHVDRCCRSEPLKTLRLSMVEPGRFR